MRVIHDIPGGIHPPERKALSRPGQLRELPLPNRLVLPMRQHIGAPASPIVKEGDRVLGGQCIAEATTSMSVAVHAPTSGTIVRIGAHPIAHASGLDDLCIELETDGSDQWLSHSGVTDYRAQSPETLMAHIQQAGIAGLGGAGFPTAVKLLARERGPIETLIINGTECEPYITADDTLMQCEASAIIEGAQILAYIVGAANIVIAVEDNKPDALAAMTAAAGADIEVATFPTKYPSGGEKQLITILTGKEVPRGGIPADIGIVCQNPGTAVAVRDAIVHGKPLTHRVITLTGEALTSPGNVRAPLGTPVETLMEFAGFQPPMHPRVIHGGPMMGFALASLAAPVIKTTNCLLAPTPDELPLPQPAQACIRCGLCAEACPASLLPQQLYWYAQAKDQQQLEKHHLFDCIECGACAWVCPSNIPLVQYYRASKAYVVDARQEKQRSENAMHRFEARQSRVAHEAQEREAKRAERKAAAAAKAAASGEDPVQAAIARAAARKAAQAETADEPGDPS